MRNLIDTIIIAPGGALFQVVGNLQGILAAAVGKTAAERLPVMLVAGARNHLNLEFSWAAA